MFPALSEKPKSKTMRPYGLDALFPAVFTLSLFTKLLYFQFMTGLNTLPVFSRINTGMFVSTFCVLLCIVSFMSLVFAKKRNLMLLAFLFFTVILLIGDTIYFRYYYSTLNLSLIYHIPLMYTTAEAGTLKNSVTTLYTVGDVIYIWDLVFVILFFRAGKKIERPGTFSSRKRLVYAAIGLLAFSGLSGGGGYEESGRKYSNSMIRKDGIGYYHLYDLFHFIKNGVAGNETLSAAEAFSLNSLSNGKVETGKEYRGEAKGRNLLMIQVEALQQFVINREVNGNEITPHLNKLIQSSFYFDNIYYQTADGGTSDAELASNASLYPLRRGSAYLMYPRNSFHSLAKALKGRGYSTFALHAFTNEFWNRQAMYAALGFDRFINLNNFEKDDMIGWSLSDASFFRQSLDKMDYGGPFYAFMVTISSHYPYAGFSGHGFDAGEYGGSLLGNYLKAANYTDHSIGLLIDDLKKRGLYDNTILVIYGDHHAIPRSHSNELVRLMGVDSNALEWTKLQKVPLIIRIPSQISGEVIRTAGGQIDIMPTIANLMDFDVPYALGKDLLNAKEGYAALMNGSFVTDNYLFLEDAGEAYDLETGRRLGREEYMDKKKALEAQIDLSEVILRKNALEGK